MKAFLLRGKYVPATSILHITPPSGRSYKPTSWSVALIGGSIVELDETSYSEVDLTALYELVDYFGINYKLAAKAVT